nr:hypothetical protein [Tanacetum cinerariifolium]
MSRRSKRSKRIPLKLIDIVYNINGKKSNKKNDAMEFEKDEVSDVFNGGDDDFYDDIGANGKVNNSSDQHAAKEWNKDNIGENRVDSNRKATENANAEFVSNAANNFVHDNSINMNSYAKAVGSNRNDLDKNLFFVPTGLSDSGEEAVIFKEELVIEAMCHKGIGRAGYARVLVEMEASRGLPDKIEIVYKDVMNKTTMTKYVRVEYDWKPVICITCEVFGHREHGCKNRSANAMENGNEKEKVNKANNGKERDE